MALVQTQLYASSKRNFLAHSWQRTKETSRRDMIYKVHSQASQTQRRSQINESKRETTVKLRASLLFKPQTQHIHSHKVSKTRQQIHSELQCVLRVRQSHLTAKRLQIPEIWRQLEGRGSACVFECVWVCVRVSTWQINWRWHRVRAVTVHTVLTESTSHSWERTTLNKM